MDLQAALDEDLARIASTMDCITVTVRSTNGETVFTVSPADKVYEKITTDLWSSDEVQTFTMQQNGATTQPWPQPVGTNGFPGISCYYVEPEVMVTLGDQELSRGSTFEESGVEDGARLSAELFTPNPPLPRSSIPGRAYEELRMFVANVRGEENFQVDITHKAKAAMTVWELKHEICAVFARASLTVVPRGCILMNCQGQAMRNDHTLRDHDIQDGHQLRVVLLQPIPTGVGGPRQGHEVVL